VQSIVTPRFRRQVDNQAEENPIMQQGQVSGDKEKRDDETSTATPIIKDPSRLFVPKAPYLERLQHSRNEGSLRTFWRCLSKSKSISHFWMPSSKCRHMSSS
jgi:hypothetical protein